jgi:F-type H+-transporting ATPase subunit delta
MIVSKAAKRYARAFFKIAQEKKCLDKVTSDFASIVILLEDSAELNSFFKAPLISSENKKVALKALFSGRVHELTLELLIFLADKNRLEITQDTLLEFSDLSDALNNIQRVLISSAFELDKAQVESITKRLHEKLNKNIVAQVRVEPTLIGGFKVKVGDLVHDLSVATQLNKLKQNIVKA